MANNPDILEASETDINDVFDSIAFSEERISNEAFQQGFSKGKKEGKIEGYHLGYHRGAELGAEIGFYKGMVHIMQAYGKDHPIKIASTLEKLKTLLEVFPKDNCDNIDILAAVDNIRAQYKKITSLLKLNLTYPISSRISF